MQFNLTPVIKNLLIVNLGVFLGVFLLQNVGIDLVDYFGLHHILSDLFFPTQFLTHMFLHVKIGHIIGNMFGLVLFGSLLENFWGAKRFLTFYLITGVGAGLVYMAVNSFELWQLKQEADAYIVSPTPTKLVGFMKAHDYGNYRVNDKLLNDFEEKPNSQHYLQISKAYVQQVYEAHLNGVAYGASGALFGILMAMGLLFPNTELFLYLIPFPVKVKYVVALYGIFELQDIIQRAPNDSVAHFGHLGGALFAFILIKFWNSRRDKFY
ncbi:MAG: rhomboid family intramembrane serine protease [Bacteroidota bacterium]